MLSIEKITQLARENGTPLYIFDKDELSSRIESIREILGEDVDICYAMKANPFLVDAARQQHVRFEVCSPGEFSICERENVVMSDIVLSGVNKEKHDIEHVMDDCGGAGMYTVESLSQFELLCKCAQNRGIIVPVLLRVTSGNQFGLDEAEIERLVCERDSHKNVDIHGIQCYTGTQKKKLSHIVEELEWLDGLCGRLKEKYGFTVRELEYGPGLPVSYFGDEAFDNSFDMLKGFAEALKPLKSKYKITLEMGRFIAATCGIYVSAVADTKTNKGQNYCIIDGGINHINYYGQTMAMKIPGYSFVKADGTVAAGYGADGDRASESPEKWTVCGSLCTVADVIVKNLPIGEPETGDLLIFYNIGAYSVTEGIYLFLSRRMPKIIAYSESEGVSLYRDFKFSDILNSRENLE